MKTTNNILLSLLLSGLALLAAFPVLPASPDAPPPPRNNLLAPGQEAEREPPVSRRQASDLARDSFPGRVLSIRLEEGRWRVRMDQDGTVFNVFVDAQDGSVTRTSEQD